MEISPHGMRYSGKWLLCSLLFIKYLWFWRRGLETTKSRRSGTWSTQKSQNNYCLNNKNPLLITKVAGSNMISRDKRSRCGNEKGGFWPPFLCYLNLCYWFPVRFNCAFWWYFGNNYLRSRWYSPFSSWTRMYTIGSSESLGLWLLPTVDPTPKETPVDWSITVIFSESRLTPREINNAIIISSMMN